MVKFNLVVLIVNKILLNGRSVNKCTFQREFNVNFLFYSCSNVHKQIATDVSEVNNMSVNLKVYGTKMD